MTTYSPKKSDIERTWHLIDADGLILGRMASEIAKLLRGKHKPTYSPHMDMGDNVIIVNAEKIALTGKKREDKIYYWHTGYPGGIKSRKASDILDGKFPERVLMKAVKRMLPKGPLAKRQLTNLRVYSGSSHPHEAQDPTKIDVKNMNSKNINRN